MSQRKLAKNIGSMSSSVFLSRVLGLIRDQVMAYFFGTTYLNDAFNVAYNLPNLLRRLFGEGALSAAFVPIYNEIGIKKGKKEQIIFAINVLSILTLFLAALTLIGITFAPFIIRLLYPGLAPHTFYLAVKLSRIMFPYLFLIGISSTLIAILNSHDYFFMTGLSSALLNVGMIAAVIIPALCFGIGKDELAVWSAWGVFIGGVFQTMVNLPYLKKVGYNVKVIIRFSGYAIQNLWKRFIPAMVGIGIREINLITDAIMASFLPIGSITALGFGNRLMQLPLGIFGISTGTAVLPLFSQYVTENKWDDLSRSIRFSTIALFSVMLPATSLIIILGNDFVRILFQRGVFDQHATWMTYQALLFYSLGLVFFSLNQTITPLFYANKDTKTPVKIAAIMVAVNIVLNFILMQFMQHRGLALSTSITGMLNYFTLLGIIKRKLPQVSFQGISNQILKLFIINLALFSICFLINSWINVTDSFMMIVKVLVFSVSYLVFSIFLATTFKIDYMDTIKRNLWSRFTKRLIKK